MDPIRINARVKAGAIGLLAIGIVILIVTRFGDSSAQGRLRLPVGNGIPAISLGERHGLILASDGSLWAWGSDFLGWPVLGLGDATHRTTSLRRVGKETNWVSISAGENHNLAIKSDGSLWTWGESVQAERVRMKPISAPIAAASGNDWKQAAAGGYHSAALKQDGTLWTWGNSWAGQLGIGSSNGCSVPVQVGSATNWIKVWAGILETVALQSDGSLWYWGENPDPSFGQGVGQIIVPTRVSQDTNWVDVSFGVNTVFAIKSDGSLWAWGRHAHSYTGITNTVQDAMPARVGTHSDWQSISASSGWWCQLLTKKDGSLWIIDASLHRDNGPSDPFYGPVEYRQAPYTNQYVTYAGGSVHAAAPGVHGPIGVILTREGEVWTWGMELGDPLPLKGRVQALEIKLARFFHLTSEEFYPPPVYRKEPWQIPNN